MFDTWSLLSVSLMGLCKGLHSLPLIFFCQSGVKIIIIYQKSLFYIKLPSINELCNTVPWK